MIAAKGRDRKREFFFFFLVLVLVGNRERERQGMRGRVPCLVIDDAAFTQIVKSAVLVRSRGGRL